MVEVGRREEGREEVLFKASLNGEGEVVFLGSFEYMVVMVSADAVYSPKAHIYIAQGIGASQPRLPCRVTASRSIVFLRLRVGTTNDKITGFGVLYEGM